jgi:hypothetical protein
MPLQSARCAWEVQAGMIPGQPDPELTRRWGMTSEEWAAKNGMEVFCARQAQAEAWARYLHLLCVGGRTCNWTRLDFIWF